MCACPKCVMTTINDAYHETMATFQKTFTEHLLSVKTLLHSVRPTPWVCGEKETLVMTILTLEIFFTDFKTLPLLSSPAVSEYPS